MRGFILAVLMVVATTSAHPEEIQGEEPTTKSAEESQKEQIRKLMKLMGTEELLKKSLPQLVAQVKQAMPQVPVEFWENLIKEVDPKAIVAIYVSIFQKHFSQEDIEGLSEFYKSPTGRKLVTEMPSVQKEMSDELQKLGAKLGKRIEAELSKTSSTNSPIPNGQRRQKLTEEQKAQIVRGHGLDPARVTFDEYNEQFAYKKEEATPAPAIPAPLIFTPRPGSFPSFMIYISVPGEESRSYVSEIEPKPFGSGYKFKDWPSDIEITVSGNVSIFKIR